MEIRIIETKQIEELTITDPKTGCCWIGDFIGNDESLLCNKNGVYYMTEESFNWWEDHATKYEKADERKHQMIQELDDSEELETYLENIDVEFNDYPAALESAMDEWEESV